MRYTMSSKHLEWVSDLSDKDAHLKTFRTLIERALPYVGDFRFKNGGGGEVCRIRSLGKGKLCYGRTPAAPNRPEGIATDGMHRSWDAFGFLEPDAAGNLDNVVQINIPLLQNTGRDSSVSGFFARDLSTGDIAVLHGGRINGGKGDGTRIKIREVLDYFAGRVTKISLGNKKSRDGIVVTTLKSPSFIDEITSFVGGVAQVKGR